MTELAGATVLGLPIVQWAAVALASLLCGFVGTFVVLRRLVALGGGIAHAAFGGIGLGVVLGFEPRLGAAVVAAAAAAYLAGETLAPSDRRDAAIGVLWAIGMATGMLLLAGSAVGDADVEGYLFGDIETVRAIDVGVLGALVAVVAFVHLRFGREIVATAFDAEHAQLQGLPVRRLELGGMLLVALSVVALLQLVGVVLAIALLAIPPLVALRRLRGLPAVVAGATACAAVMSVAGLALGAATGKPAGPLIVLVGGALLAVSRLLPVPPVRAGR